MERLCRWLNRFGTYSVNGEDYGPGEEFIAAPSQVPAIFRDVIDCLGDVEEGGEATVAMPIPTLSTAQIPPAPAKFTRRAGVGTIQVQDPVPGAVLEINVTDQPDVVIPTTIFRVEPREGSAGWYDVVNTVTKGIVNFKALRFADAGKLAEGMNNGTPK